MRPLPITLLALCLSLLALPARALTPAELELREKLGPDTPEPIPLWPDKPPRFVENAAPEKIGPNAQITNISVPTISVYLPSTEGKAHKALIVCPGGGYGAMDWKTHVVYAAQVFNRLGVAVIGLKYRTRPPNGRTNEEIQAIALLDAQRAVRLVRHRAAEWQIDPHQIGVAGYSAGANLAMNLAANFEDGERVAGDPVDAESSRPDFVVGLATWHWRQKESPFVFQRQSPPVFLVHASNDGLTGGAPIELPQAIERQLKALGVPVHLEVFDQGAHGVGNLIPQRVQHGFPPAQWPQLLLAWLEQLPPNVGGELPPTANHEPRSRRARKSACSASVSRRKRIGNCSVTVPLRGSFIWTFGRGRENHAGACAPENLTGDSASGLCRRCVLPLRLLRLSPSRWLSPLASRQPWPLASPRPWF